MCYLLWSHIEFRITFFISFSFSDTDIVYPFVVNLFWYFILPDFLVLGFVHYWHFKYLYPSVWGLSLNWTLEVWYDGYHLWSRRCLLYLEQLLCYQLTWYLTETRTVSFEYILTPFTTLLLLSMFVHFISYNRLLSYMVPASVSQRKAYKRASSWCLKLRPILWYEFQNLLL